MSAPQTYGASLYDLAKDEGMSREILVDLEGIVSLFNEHPAYVKILDAPQIAVSYTHLTLPTKLEV